MEPPVIRTLSQDVVNRIAAGEVIHRPSSALKEMLENSLDAGSTSIAVTCKEGGLKLLQIQDNGHGIREIDLPILCERFTTSKITTHDDLQKLHTFGFRGEALASISHVAHLTVTTMTASSKCAFKATYTDGKLSAARPGESEAPRACAGVRGTQIQVEDLFYNIPTRRKAFKNPSDEYSRTLDVVTRYALHFCHVAFSCKKVGESHVDVHTTVNTDRRSTVCALFGRQLAAELLTLSVEDKEKGVKVNGLISNPNWSQKKSTFVLFINDRLVESATIKKTIDEVHNQPLRSVLEAQPPLCTQCFAPHPPAHTHTHTHTHSCTSTPTPGCGCGCGGGCGCGCGGAAVCVCVSHTHLHTHAHNRV